MTRIKTGELMRCLEADACPGSKHAQCHLWCVSTIFCGTSGTTVWLADYGVQYLVISLHATLGAILVRNRPRHHVLHERTRRAIAGRARRDQGLLVSTYRCRTDGARFPATDRRVDAGHRYRLLKICGTLLTHQGLTDALSQSLAGMVLYIAQPSFHHASSLSRLS